MSDTLLKKTKWYYVNKEDSFTEEQLMMRWLCKGIGADKRIMAHKDKIEKRLCY
jgi:hypothetical protein